MEDSNFMLEHFQQNLALVDGLKDIIKAVPIPSSSSLIRIMPKAMRLSHSDSHHVLAHYVLTLMTFLERFSVIPYKIEHRFETDLPSGNGIEFQIVVSKWKKKLIQFLMLVVTLYHIYLLVRILKNNGTWFFSLIRAVINFSLTCWTNVIVIILWKCRNSIMCIIARIHRIGNLLEKRTGVKFLKPSKAFWLATLISLGSGILSILEVIVFDLKIESLNLYEILANEADELNIFTPRMGNYAAGKCLLVFVGLFHCLINKMYYLSVGHFGYGILFIFSHVIFKLFQALNNTKVLFSSVEEMTETLESYAEIRKLLRTVNRTFGSMMAWGIIGHLPYNAYKVKDFIDGSTSYQMSYIIHYIMYLGTLLVAARVHSEVEGFVEKISTRVSELNDKELESRTILIVQQAKTTGMKGNGLFLITYGFLGNIIGVVLTYAILIVQFQKN